MTSTKSKNKSKPVDTVSVSTFLEQQEDTPIQKEAEIVPVKSLSIWDKYEFPVEKYIKPQTIKCEDIDFHVDLGSIVSGDYWMLNGNALDEDSSFLEKKQDATVYFVQNCLKGWNNFPDKNGELIPFSKEKAIELFNKLPMLATLLVRLSLNKAGEIQAEKDEDIKN